MKQEQLILVSLQESVLHYANLSKKSGLDGVVCSSHEAALIRERIGGEFLTVTPGIRLKDDAVGDQKRVATPEFARQQVYLIWWLDVPSRNQKIRFKVIKS